MNENEPLINSIKSRSSTASSSLPSSITVNNKKNLTYVLPSLEDEKTYKDRYFSIRLGYICMFASSVSFTICISSMWPFLQIIDKTDDTVFFGWIVAAFSLGQLLASPLFGYWAVKSSNHKIPLLTCIILNIVANILYAYLQSMTFSTSFTPKHWMLIARFIMGTGAGSAAIMRSYVSGATTLEERTSALANISACQGLGFIIGPVLQAALVPIHFPGLVEQKSMHFNMYTAPAYLSIAIYLILFIMVIVKFNEYMMLNQDTEKLFNQSAKNVGINSESYNDVLSQLPQPDRFAIISSLLLFFICCFVFSFYETFVLVLSLSSPLTIDMYAWSSREATFYNGLILGGLGVFSVAILLVTKIFAKKYSEKLTMVFGYILLFFAAFSLLPWGDDYPSVQIPTLTPGHRNVTYFPIQNVTTYPEPPPRGCPLEYDWCFYTPIIKFYQFMIGCVLLVTGYSIANVMSFAIYSKLLGPWPQGTMMGLLTSIGSLARALGPIIVSYLYGIYGPRVSFLFLLGLVVAALLVIAISYRRYNPYSATRT